MSMSHIRSGGTFSSPSQASHADRMAQAAAYASVPSVRCSKGVASAPQSVQPSALSADVPSGAAYRCHSPRLPSGPFHQKRQT